MTDNADHEPTTAEAVAYLGNAIHHVGTWDRNDWQENDAPALPDVETIASALARIAHQLTRLANAAETIAALTPEPTRQ